MRYCITCKQCAENPKRLTITHYTNSLSRLAELIHGHDLKVLHSIIFATQLCKIFMKEKVKSGSNFLTITTSSTIC